ncbi:MAG: oligosaccharide flippase family protein [Ruminococcus sp.]|nr:oligosaccharide flippase family protein [Ruminococcus sp.]
MICSFLQKGIQMITTPIFTRLLSTAEYGQYLVFNSWKGILSVSITLNLFYGVYEQGLVKFSEERNVLSSSLQGLTLVLALFWTIVYLAFCSFWNNVFSLTTVQMLAMIVIIWTTAAYNFWAAEQRVLYKYGRLVAVTMFASISDPVLSIIMVVHSDDKATVRILSTMLIQLIAYTGLFAVQMIRGKKICSPRFWKYAVCFNLPLIPHYLSQTVLNSSDRIMIKNMIGESEAGIYGLAYSIALIMMLFNTAISQTLSPWTYQKIKDKHELEIAPVGYSTLIMVAVLNLALIAFAPEAVRIFAPEEYYPAIWIIPPVAMSGYFIYTYSLFSAFSFYYEKSKMIMLSSVLAALANLGLNYIFINRFGYVAAGYTTLVCYIIYSLGHFFLMKKICKEFCGGRCPYSFRTIMSITIPFLTAGFLIMFSYNYIAIRYGAAALAVITAAIKRKKIADAVKKILEIKKDTAS